MLGRLRPGLPTRAPTCGLSNGTHIPFRSRRARWWLRAPNTSVASNKGEAVSSVEPQPQKAHGIRSSRPYWLKQPHACPDSNAGDTDTQWENCQKLWRLHFKTIF